MFRFTSRRERRLWLGLALAQVAIWASLAVGPRLVASLETSVRLEAAFAVGMILVVITLALLAFRSRWHSRELAIVFGTVAVFWLLAVRIASPAERTHLVEYAVVAALLYEVLVERTRQGARVPMPWLLAFVGAFASGCVDESIQALIPSRVFDPRDLLFNALAAALAVMVQSTRDWLRRRG